LFDQGSATDDFADQLEFAELDASDPELEQLIERVHAARLAGA